MTAPAGPEAQPRASVVVPTYNRARELARSLEFLAAQTVPPGSYEVIVSDDGSSDDTQQVVRSFASRLPLRYHFQQDEGFRAATARNAGARLARGDVLVFLDAGTLPGPGFVAGHLAAHAGSDGAGDRAVIGYVYGYQHERGSIEGYDRALATLTPAQLRDRFDAEPYFRDMRHDEYAAVDFELSRRAVPCLLFWSANISVRSAPFWAAGGFDEGFVSWGMEDIDLGYRLWKRGLRFALTRDAWAVEGHQHDRSANHESNLVNAQRFLEKTNFAEPLLELAAVAFLQEVLFEIEGFYRLLLDWTAQVRLLDVSDEIGQVAAGLPEGTRLAVFGAGAVQPSDLIPSVLVDFDRDAVDAAAASGRHSVHHNIGIRTPLPDGCADIVLISSRLRGLWDAWGSLIVTEAKRLGSDVRVMWA